MKPLLLAIPALLLLAGAAPTAHALECAAGVHRAGCAGPDGAAAKGTLGVAPVGKPGAYAGSDVQVMTLPSAGTNVADVRGDSTTKVVQSGCGWVNGYKACY